VVCYGREGITYPVRQSLELEGIVRALGAYAIAWEPQYGWDNQPEVLTFRCSPARAAVIDARMPHGLMVTEYWRY
jgi:hypothetical protein